MVISFPLVGPLAEANRLPGRGDSLSAYKSTAVGTTRFPSSAALLAGFENPQRPTHKIMANFFKALRERSCAYIART
jgi:hypothetical protein